MVLHLSFSMANPIQGIFYKTLHQNCWNDYLAKNRVFREDSLCQWLLFWFTLRLLLAYHCHPTHSSPHTLPSTCALFLIQTLFSSYTHFHPTHSSQPTHSSHSTHFSHPLHCCFHTQLFFRYKPHTRYTSFTLYNLLTPHSVPAQ